LEKLADREFEIEDIKIKKKKKVFLGISQTEDLIETPTSCFKNNINFLKML
jgi:hypothetical protein